MSVTAPNGRNKARSVSSFMLMGRLPTYNSVVIRGSVVVDHSSHFGPRGGGWENPHAKFLFPEVFGSLVRFHIDIPPSPVSLGQPVLHDEGSHSLDRHTGAERNPPRGRDGCAFQRSESAGGDPGPRRAPAAMTIGRDRGCPCDIRSYDKKHPKADVQVQPHVGGRMRHSRPRTA
jgi:hypothetical protein